MSSEPVILELAPQPTAVERAVTDRAGMRATIDRTFGALFTALTKLGVTPAGAPFIRYLKTGDQLEIELGVPVPPDTGRLPGVDKANLPGGRVAVLRYTGPYEDLQAACEGLASWVRERGEKPGGPHWECYVTNPATEPDPDRRITDICLPVS